MDVPIYTAWGSDGQARYFVSGSERPHLGDGTFMPNSEELIWTVEARSWEEAVKRYYQLQGWELPDQIS
jgi:hypothetical protein